MFQNSNAPIAQVTTHEEQPIDGLLHTSVLILDDDAFVRETLCTLIRSTGMKADCASTKEEFFSKLESNQFDVIILDLIMPDCDGLEVLRNLARLRSHEVIITSGCGDRILQATKLSAESSGVNILGILPKPFRRQQLRSLLAMAKPLPLHSGDTKKAVTRPKIDEISLRKAITKREIVCYLQPKIRLSDDSIYGFEALARWHDSCHGTIFPDEFIPLASTYGLDLSLSLSMLDQAAGCLASLSDQSLSVAVNVSVKVCADPEFGPALHLILEHHGLSSEHVILEVTEAGPNGISNDELDALMRLRLKGHTLSIDDFGTGASSMERLVRIPFGELKIDRLFVRDIDKSRNTRRLIRTFVQMARLFEMDVTIEGVETEDAINISKKLGCDNAQGYGVARPMSIEAVQGWLAERNRDLESSDPMKA